MEPQRAIRHLEELRLEPQNDRRLRLDDAAVNSWKNRVRAVLERSLGASSHVVEELDAIWFSPGVYYEGQPESDYIEARERGLRSAIACIDAAIYELGIVAGDDVTLAASNFDAELWQHVAGLVQAEDWIHLPAAVAIFVEDRVREWSGSPNTLVGRGLYARAMADDGVLRLGALGSEWEGWRALGMGLAQAVGNVNRHRIERREDIRSYAIGVLGLGSLLLLQLRREHPDLVGAVESAPFPEHQ